ncbi:MAG: GIY-YIG nuclease family protein [Paludibacter sp.]|nr:GIY-YIG nuclease family protein [Paludibacter sp.]
MGIYIISNVVNGKMYIGSSVDLKKRKRDHLRELRQNIHCNDRLQNSFNKYGEKNFKFEIVEHIDDRDNLIEAEQNWINKTNAADKNVGLNINRLAVGGGNFGEINGNYGNRGAKNPLSKRIAQIEIETLEIIKIWDASIEIKRKLGFHSGNICKMCIDARDKNILHKSNGFYWVYEESISKIKDMSFFVHKKRTTKPKPSIRSSKNPNAKKVIQLDLDGKFINKYNCVKDGAEAIGISPCCIYSHLSSGRNSAGGYKWMYLE